METYRKDKVPTLKGSESRGDTDWERMTQQSPGRTRERDEWAPSRTPRGKPHRQGSLELV